MTPKLSPIPKLVLKRLAIGVLTLIVVSAVIFWAVELLPGNIATEVLGQSATPETIATLLEWSVEGRAGSVALAPLTAILQTR